MKKSFLIIPFIVFTLIFLTFFYLLISERDPSEIPSNLLNKNVPIFKAESLLNDKKFISVKEFGKEPLLVNFFATWCKPCRDEHKYIQSFADKEIRVIGINYKDNPEKTIRWLKELGNPYTDIALDINGTIAIDWGVYGIPETFIIDSSGVIKYRHKGPLTKKTFKKIYLLIKKTN